jgi:hypothetical protein
MIYRNEARQALGWTAIEGDETIFDPTASLMSDPYAEEPVNNQEKKSLELSIKAVKDRKKKAKKLSRAYDLAMSKQVPAAQKEILEFLNKQVERIVAGLTDEDLKSTDLLSTKAISFDGEDKEVKKFIRTVHDRAIKTAVEDVNEVYSANSEVSTTAEVKNLGKLITRINDTTREFIVRNIKDGVQEGLNVNQIASKIVDRANEINESRALMIARTETRMAYQAGTKMVFEDMGVKTFSIIGCSEEEPGYDCNREGMPMDYEPVLHPNCTGCVVAD